MTAMTTPPQQGITDASELRDEILSLLNDRDAKNGRERGPMGYATVKEAQAEDRVNAAAFALLPCILEKLETYRLIDDTLAMRAAQPTADVGELKRLIAFAHTDEFEALWERHLDGELSGFGFWKAALTAAQPGQTP